MVTSPLSWFLVPGFRPLTTWPSGWFYTVFVSSTSTRTSFRSTFTYFKNWQQSVLDNTNVTYLMVEFYWVPSLFHSLQIKSIEFSEILLDWSLIDLSPRVYHINPRRGRDPSPETKGETTGVRTVQGVHDRRSSSTEWRLVNLLGPQFQSTPTHRE